MLRTASDELPSLVLIKQSTATPRTSDEEEIRAEDLIILKRQISAGRTRFARNATLRA